MPRRRPLQLHHSVARALLPVRRTAGRSPEQGPGGEAPPPQDVRQARVHCGVDAPAPRSYNACTGAI